MSELTYRQALLPGYRLLNYRLNGVLGAGGFGVTYRAFDTLMERDVAIKEYMPNEFAVRDGTTVVPKTHADRDSFDWGLDSFVTEARALARFDHDNLARVYQFFEANETAYIVMAYEVGEPLDSLLKRNGVLTEVQLLDVLCPIAEGLQIVHEHDWLHRDIKPANILVRRDGTPVLLDFGAARSGMSARSRNMTAIVSKGYSPPEQYDDDSDTDASEQGPWSDIYSFSAVAYLAITGEVPIDAARRMRQVLSQGADPLKPLAGRVDSYSASLLEGVDAGLRLGAAQRPADVATWLGMIVPGSDSSGTTLESPGTKRGRAPSGEIPSKALVRIGWHVWVVGVASVVLGAAVGALLFAWVGDHGNMEPQPFQVTVVPADAAIRIPGRPDWVPGGPLPPGDYGVVAEAGGHMGERVSVRHGPRPTVHHIALTERGPFSVVTNPEKASVRFVDMPDIPYRPGMPLATGKYAVEVSAPGYRPVRSTLLHHTGVRRHHVALTSASDL